METSSHGSVQQSTLEIIYPALCVFPLIVQRQRLTCFAREPFSLTEFTRSNNSLVSMTLIWSFNLYGSPLWQLYSEEHQKLNRSWNTAVKLIWELPYATHTRLLEDLCPVSHLEHVLLSRYIGFIQNLCKSNEEILCLIFKSCLSNYRSVTGRNLFYLFKKFDIQTIHQLFNVKAKLKDMRVYDLPGEENGK